MSLLAPPLTRLIDAASRLSRGQATEAEVRSALAGMRDFCSEGRALFGLVSPGVLRTPEVDRILEECRQDLDGQEQALQQLDQALGDGSGGRLGPAVERLRSAATRLASGYVALHEEEKKEKIYSPFPVLDHFVKVGMNVLEGHVSKGELTSRFTPVVALVQRLERDVARFRALYQAPEVAEPMQHLVGAMHAGLGAMVEYFETGRGPALADGLKLLGRGSSAAFEGLAEMDRVAAAGRRSSHPYLEELHRSLEAFAAGRLTWPMVQDSWQLVQAASRYYRREMEAFRRFPLAPFLGAEEAPARAALRDVEAEVARLEPAFAQGGQPEAGRLEPLFDALSQGVHRLWDRIEEEVGRYSEAPHFAELRERVGRALLGEPSGELLAGQLHHSHGVQQGLSAEAAAGGLDPALARELAEIFAAQDEAYQVMIEALEGPDLASLRRGWDLLEATMPRMMEIVRGLRQALEAARPAAAGPTCLRCGQANDPGTRYCRSCNAVLPEMSKVPTEYTDILGGGSEGPTRLSLLEDLVARVEAGGAEPEEVLPEVEALEKMATQVARNLEQQVAPTAQGVSAEYAAFFHGQVQQYLHGLEWIRACVAEGNPGALRRGLESCRAAEEAIVDMKREIEAQMAVGE